MFAICTKVNTQGDYRYFKRDGETIITVPQLRNAEQFDSWGEALAFLTDINLLPAKQMRKALKLPKTHMSHITITGERYSDRDEGIKSSTSMAKRLYRFK